MEWVLGIFILFYLFILFLFFIFLFIPLFLLHSSRAINFVFISGDKLIITTRNMQHNTH